MFAAWRVVFASLAVLGAAAFAQTYSAPAGIRPAHRRPGASILPGGRIIAPLGDEYATGPGSFGIAIGATGRSVAVANVGPWRASITTLDRFRSGRWEARQIVPMTAQGAGFAPSEWSGVSIGIAFSGDRSVWVSEGNSGRVSFIDTTSDERRRAIDINQAGLRDSFTGDLAFDSDRGILYVADQANCRIAVVEVKTRQVIASAPTGRLPFVVALSPNRKTLYVANAGIFQYKAIAGADPNQARTTGLLFPPFGFPSPEALAGASRKTATGEAAVPALGDAGAPESDSLTVMDVSTPAGIRVITHLRTGDSPASKIYGGSSPSGIVATDDRVYISNAGSDSITVVDAKSNTVMDEIPIRIPGLEDLRGVMPAGLALDETSGWLLVAEAGINAVGVIDTKLKRVIGHLPAAWYPTRVEVDGGTVFVTNARGHGVGANAATAQSQTPVGTFSPARLFQGTLSVFQMPKAEALAAHTEVVMRANGFVAQHIVQKPLPEAIRHVVLIVKEGKSFDEVLGDMDSSSNRSVMSAASLARLGTSGSVDGGHLRLSIKEVNLTPNHHALAQQWAISDNFYADSDGGSEGHHWLAGAYLNPWTFSSFMAAYTDRKEFRFGAATGRLGFEGLTTGLMPEDIPQAGTIWRHLTARGVTSASFGEGLDVPGSIALKGLQPGGSVYLTNSPMPDELYRAESRAYPSANSSISDQYRATQFIHEIDERFVKPGADLPSLITIALPGDGLMSARPADGYPYPESPVADNDLALGRIMEYLSQSKWWSSTVVFVTESSAVGGLDHVHANRTLLIAAGPWVKKGYTSHVNVSFPGLLKTVLELLHAPALNLFDASASDLRDLFAASAEGGTYKVRSVDKRIFDPAGAGVH